MTSKIDSKETAGGVSFTLLVVPGASRNTLVGLEGGALKVRIAAPPVEGKANRECLRFLSDLLGVPKETLRIARGKGGRRKQVIVSGLDVRELTQRLSSQTQA